MQTFKKSKPNMVSAGRKLTKITLVVSMMFLGFSEKTSAQNQTNERTITINMSASELLPADLIIFNVNINAEAETPQEAYSLHKERESLLAKLLKQNNINEENIDYQPIRMSRVSSNYRNNGNSKVTRTNQSVSLTFNDFGIYEEIQVALIENGFDSFNGQFSSTKISEGKEQALVSAIESAKQKAQLIAKTSGFSLGPVQTINYSDHQIGFPAKSNVMSMEAMRSDASMMDFSQTVSVTANINVSFSID
ncbi:MULTISPECIES: SIMPL domain-containing protein [Gracilimonas]|uniref:SIMPL domain-containing protein n=1 Tax=Gracilimonas sediminicola TaxID=2952158 RepID=A0A9X2RBL2_9BACT|nr:SIMPL domain-containing protein [Gracilimonas sediminicola]MCP9290410.1 SIMPL domain-containing protein [Gracilimonas sediminicola]